MGGASIWHWIVVGLVVMLLFGRGKISEMMGDVAKGIKAFKKGMSEDEEAKPAQAAEASKSLESRTIDHKPASETPASQVGEHKAG
jgi:sec-independent protein translocase protein TatA